VRRTAGDVDDPIDRRLRLLAETCRAVWFAGLPGTGKSFLTQRLAGFANAADRPVHLLQWDVARPVFEAAPAGRCHPLRDGITDPIIRKAAGVWAREAMARWHADHPPADILIGECPLVGHRFVELVCPDTDPVEQFLAGEACAFVVPVPSVEVRRVLEGERDRRSVDHRHDREQEDALPAVLRALWDEVVDAAKQLGIEHDAGKRGPLSYDPAVYARVYGHVLARRHAHILPVDRLIPTSAASVYAFPFPTHDVVPTPLEAEACIEAVEAQYADLDALDREVARWYLV